jgi:hypothetical protein
VNLASGHKRDGAQRHAGSDAARRGHRTGQRIAFFALQPNSGQRDIFTVAANGSGADAPSVDGDQRRGARLDAGVVTQAAITSTFSSNRGGTMNLWRVAIDEASGRPRGEPEPVTTPTAYGGRMSFSRDGLLMAYASLDWRSTMLRQAFDPAREQVVGPPMPMFKGSRPVRDHAISPDGQWVVFNETTPQGGLVRRASGRPGVSPPDR